MIRYQSVVSMMYLCTVVLYHFCDKSSDSGLHQIDLTLLQFNETRFELLLFTVHTRSSHCCPQLQDILADPSDAFLQQRRKLIEMNKAGTITVPGDWKPDPAQQLGP